jgi:16S rRNA (guanine527-N7)-methyltransferase
MKRVSDYLIDLEISVPVGLSDKLELYLRELLDWNSRFNLTAVREREEIIVKHFMDSLSATPYIPECARLIDIGSGAGFPAIPLKLVRPDIKVTMLDSVGKKVNFLQHMIDTFNLQDTEAVHVRAEDFIKDKGRRGSYDIAVARAVAPLNILLEYCLPYLRKGGRMIAYKGAECEEELKISENALKILKSEISEVIKFVLPDTDMGRALIIIESKGDIPVIYPRGGNGPRKKPL